MLGAKKSKNEVMMAGECSARAKAEWGIEYLNTLNLNVSETNDVFFIHVKNGNDGQTKTTRRLPLDE